MLRKIKGESHSYPEYNLELCKRNLPQPSTGRLYLETDIDRVRQLDKLVANGTPGNERNEKVLEKCVERGKEREKRKDRVGERDRGPENGKKGNTGGEKPCWEKDRRLERGREKEKKMIHTSFEHLLPQSISAGHSNPCPVFSWPEGLPRMSYRSTSMPRPVNMNVSRIVQRDYTSLGCVKSLSTVFRRNVSVV